MAAPIIDHNLLTLDYWQDSVTYEGKTVPGGTIGCEALNIPDTLREKLAQACRVLSLCLNSQIIISQRVEDDKEPLSEFVPKSPLSCYGA